MTDKDCLSQSTLQGRIGLKKAAFDFEAAFSQPVSCFGPKSCERRRHARRERGCSMWFWGAMIVWVVLSGGRCIKPPRLVLSRFYVTVTSSLPREPIVATRGGPLFIARRPLCYGLQEYKALCV
jgi:hypothetical protein